MRILHYSLGFPPYRTGGLVKYSVDLMRTQKSCGNIVGLLWPGQIGMLVKKQSIRRHSVWNGEIESFELINPLPVPFDEGICVPDDFMKPADIRPFQKFLEEWKPDVVHVHTLMGLPCEWVEYLSEIHIRHVFTTHDYFGLCPRVTFFHNGSICSGYCGNCVQCNTNGLSLWKMMMLQHPLYRTIKNTRLLKTLRKRHRHAVNESNGMKMESSAVSSEAKTQDYKKLRAYYVRMLEKMDVLHFNSSVAENVYRQFCQPKSSVCISITHNDIANHKIHHDCMSGKLHITYLAPAKYFKGFNRLIEALDELYEKGIMDFELHIYTQTSMHRPYLHIHEPYQYEELETIMKETDVMTAPSIWYETFGFTVAEALSYGVPVIVSTTVGAKDIVGTRFGIVTDNLKESFEKILLNREILQQYQEIVYTDFQVKQMEEHVMEIKKLYEMGIE